MENRVIFDGLCDGSFCFSFLVLLYFLDDSHGNILALHPVDRTTAGKQNANCISDSEEIGNICCGLGIWHNNDLHVNM